MKKSIKSRSEILKALSNAMIKKEQVRKAHWGVFSPWVSSSDDLAIHTRYMRF